jgi:hypothetical protein
MLKYIMFISYIYSLSFNVVIYIFDLWTLSPNVKFVVKILTTNALKI